MKRLAFAAVALLALGGCKRQKIPDALHVFVGPTGGCAQTKPHPKVGSFACWGNVFEGGEEKAYARALPFFDGKLKGISLGQHHACATTDDGKPFCWGDGARGQLGPTSSASPTPIAVGAPGATKPEAVAAGGSHTCVRGEGGDTLRCFGENGDGQLGATGDKSDWDRAQVIKTVVLGEAQTCAAYTSDGGKEPYILCRGRNMPKEPILSGHLATQLTVGADHACALLQNRSVQCWGKNDDGQLGDGTNTSSLVPVVVSGAAGAVVIAAGAHHTCALLANRTVTCWGKNDRHQLSSGTTTRSSKAEVVVGLVQVRDLAAGGDASCAILDDGLVSCWGANDNHELGDGTADEHNVPAPVKYR